MSFLYVYMLPVHEWLFGEDAREAACSHMAVMALLLHFERSKDDPPQELTSENEARI